MVAVVVPVAVQTRIVQVARLVALAAVVGKAGRDDILPAAPRVALPAEEHVHRTPRGVCVLDEVPNLLLKVVAGVVRAYPRSQHHLARNALHRLPVGEALEHRVHRRLGDHDVLVVAGR